MGRKSYKAISCLLFACLAACVKDKPGNPNTATPASSGNVYIVCEGNFGNGDASLYAYEPLQDSVFGDLFKNINHQPLGDVFQSMKRIGSKFFLCVNNSDKVVAINAADWSLAGAIPIPQPRYILPVSATRAYVTAEYGHSVYVIDPSVMQVTDTIVLPDQNPEGMCISGNNIIVCTWDTAGNHVYSIDVNTNQVAQAYQVAGYAPQEALVDREQMLWVLSGNPTAHRACTWSRIDPSTGVLLRSYTFPSAANALRPVLNNTRDTLYFIEANQDGGTAYNGIYRMGINETILPQQPFVPARQFQYFWALGIDPATGNIYIGDPKGFVQKGTAYIYRPDGTKVDSFNVGLGPGHFYFDE